MPSHADAMRFVTSPVTSVEQLRLACQILGLESGGPPEALRERLILHLANHDSLEPVVCLNPRLPPDPGQS